MTANALQYFRLLIIGEYQNSVKCNFEILSLTILYSIASDTMDNMGAFITLNGKEMKPNFTTYEAVVCI